MSRITWLHVSDWHQKGEDFDRQVVRDLLVKNINERAKIAPELAKIDFIIFSGDLAYHGKAEEYESAIVHFFNPLLEATGLGDKGRERLFIVPGNHDVDRDAFELLPDNLIEKLSTSESVAALLNDKRKRRTLFEPMADYADFISRYLGSYQDLQDDDLDYCSIKRLEVGGKSIAILCLNSTWLSGHNKDIKGHVNDRGYLILGEPQIHTALTQTSDADMRIAVLHHPFEWLNEFDRNRVEERLTTACHFILCGHQHIPQIKVTQGPGGDYIYIPAGASYDRRTPSDPRYANSYNFVSLNFDTGQGAIYLRRWNDRRTEWVTDTDVIEDGQYVFKLPKQLGKDIASPSASPSLSEPTEKDAPREKSPLKQFESDVREWLKVSSHQLESHTEFKDDGFVFITNEPITGGYDRILIYGVEGEATAADVTKLVQYVDERKTHRGWLISMRRITPLARKAAQEDERLRAYTFDELVDQKASFEKYFQWLEEEYKRRGLDRFYVDISCTKDDTDPETGEKLGTSNYESVDDYIGQWLDDPSAEHISILGEFGTGKTWFSLHYAYEALQAYKAAKNAGRRRPRLPLLIQLRDFRSMEVETLFSDFFFRKFEIGLPGYSAYQQLNRMGKLLLIFDGFDEMADRTNRQKQIDNFWALVRAVGPGAKALLTCRAEHFEFAKAAVKTLRGEETPTSSPAPHILLSPPRFEIVNLDKLSPKQIIQIITKREGEAEGTLLAQRILSVPELADLAQRAGSIEFIIAALPSLLNLRKIDLARVFLYATRELLIKNIRENRSFTSMADKVHFLCELAWQMLSTGELKVNFSQFPDRLRQYRPELKDREIDHWKFDIEGQSLLIRDDDGNYSFSHKSLPEYFVAYKLAAELGVFSPNSEWITSYFPQTRDPRALHARQWGSFFRCPNEKHICGEYFTTSNPISQCRSIGGTCISFFAREPFERSVLTFGQRILTPEVLDFLGSMVEVIDPLWELISFTKNKAFDDVAYAGGNAATLLRHMRQSFEKRNLSKAVIAGADLTNTDLTEANLCGTNLRSATLTHTTLDRADFRDADLSDISIQELNPIISLAWSPDGQTLAAVYSNYKLRLWSTGIWGKWRDIEANAKKIRGICWDSSGRRLYVLCEGGIGSIQIDKDDQFTLYQLEGRATLIDIDHTNRFLAIRRTKPYQRSYGKGSLREVSILDIETGQQFNLASTTGTHTYPTTVRFSVDMNLLYIGRYHGNIQVMDTYGHAGKPLRVFDKTAVTAISASPNSVVCGSGAGEIVFLNYRLVRKGFSLPEKYDGKILQIETSLPTGNLAILSASGQLDVWDKDRRKILSLSSQVNEWKHISFDPIGTYIAASAGGAIYIFDVNPVSADFGKCIYTLGQAVSCSGMLIGGIKGLEAPSPSGKGTLKEWLIERGAV
ncbi:MAG: metallophosphoesterase [Thermoproteota archaeon]|nr:metallophosphoesterase [Thermoproteota archaeon]